ncbi:competence protein ComEA [Laceyella sacchari]|uniref:helix-hairpin-helix domain-containing protein n=1 Tax=Laceyella sacchari TaxID=37482 RepID=UPI0010442159|nr:helix-hairpin-helix domain-containing protein [Laceyella sacchari]TCW37735.1 competence protein ComEA [Laceyella sacchari]
MVYWGWTPREKGLAIALAGVVLTVGAVWLFGQEERPDRQEWMEYPVQGNPPVTERPAANMSKQVSKNVIIIDVKGAVHKPGIYHFSTEARVYEALERAGGARDEADLGRVNLAEPLRDGMVLYIPKQGEQGTPFMEMAKADSADASGKINVNTATVEELDKLNGIGPSKAEAIVRYREEHGPFQSVEDIAQVPGIGAKTVEKFREQITVH